MAQQPSSGFSIWLDSSEPIYRQLVEQARRRVASGQLQPGERMPSVRTVARELKVNPMTISKAYNTLEQQGILIRLAGQGMQVATCAGRPAEDRMALVQAIFERAAQEARQLDLAPETVLSLFADVLKKGA